ncbi:uncharacterized protein LOC133322713 [Musca vetustissima]|uniref:uncharacterized protein LOC133322713 n=1 Tax=Musca vetustissima TaxID=27455 RepID=UPI002AB5E78A|nr:uncharacterized protein LOC133322713 [Musca vetustissima]
MEYQLIDLVKQNPILYDKKYRSFQYREEKIRKWNEIAKALRRDANFVRLKWKSLRDTYRRRLLRKDGEDDDGPTKNWKYNEQLSFLKDQYPDTAEITEIKLEDDEELQLELEEQLQEEFLHDEAEIVEEDVTIPHEPDFEVENFNLNEYLKKFDVSNNNANTTQAEEQSKKKRLDKDTIISEAAQEMASLLQCAKQHFTPPSATQIFFNSIALQVEEANLPPIDLMRLQQRVLEAVTQEIVMSQDGATYIIQT